MSKRIHAHKKLVNTLCLSAVMLTAPLLMGTTAHARSSHKFVSTVSEQISTVQVEVKIGEDLEYRADHLSKDIRNRSISSGLNNGFVGAGFYGQKDLDRLAEQLGEKTESQLMKAGIRISDSADTVLTITLTDARPNRPTFKQLSKSTSLSMRSFGLGGADMDAVLTRDGQDIGTLSYAWFESDIRDAYASGTWSDARRAIDRFAKKTAKALASESTH